MALILIEGFDHLTKDEIPQKGWSGGDVFSMTAGRPTAAPNSQGIDVIPNNDVSKVLPGTYTEIVVGFAVYLNPPVNGVLMSLNNQLSIGVNSLLQIQISDSIGVIATGTHVLTERVWHYVEVKLVAGLASARLDGATVGEIAPTSGTFGSMNTITLECHGLGASVWFDDVYVCDLTGPDNNDFLGDSHVETLYPVADGTYTQWTPLTGTDHFAMVDEPQADGDTTYNFDSTVTDKDSYEMQNLSFSTGTVFGCQLNLYARKNEAGTREVKGLIRQSETDYLGPIRALATSYQFLQWLLDKDPTGADWTIAHVNADECGIELVT